MGYKSAHWIEDSTKLTGNELALALVIAIAVDDGKAVTVRTKATLMAKTHLSERQLKYTLASLSKQGVIVVGKRFDKRDGHQIGNAYVVKQYAEAIGVTVEQALQYADSIEAMELVARKAQEAYDFGKNGKAEPLTLFDLGDMDNATPLPAGTEGGPDEAGGGVQSSAPQGVQSSAPLCLTLSFNSFTNTPIGTDVPIVQQAEAPEEEKEEEKEEELPFTDKPEPKPRTSKGRKKVAVSDEEMALRSRTSKLLQLYVEWLGYEPTSYGREGVAAKALAKSGWTDEQIEACYRSLKAERFWSDKHLSLGVVRTNIAARVGTVGTNSKGAVNGNLNTNGRFQFARDAGSANASDEGSGNTDADADAEWAAFLAERAR
jgi:hypothetical protein